MESHTHNSIGTLTDLLANDIVIERAIVREDHSIIIGIVLVSLGILLSVWILSLKGLWRRVC